MNSNDSISYFGYAPYVSLPSLHNAIIVPGARVLVRADFDIGLHAGRITDIWRAEAVLPALRILLKKKTRVRLLAHLGRPGGRRQDALTLAPVARFLSRALGRRVPLIADPFRGAWNRDAAIVLFENLRFWPGEEKNDPAFARALAAEGDLYVNEAFANCHRPHASMVLLPARMPAFAGPNLLREVEALERILHHPQRPLVAIFGGAKIETKLPLIRRFLRHTDRVLVGGAIANAIFALQGRNIGRSAADTAGASSVAFLKNKKLFLPTDVLVADRLAGGARATVRSISDVGRDEYIGDIGPATLRHFTSLVADARTIVWNGPMGYAEAPQFARGTIAIARAIRESRAFSVVGGGDSVAMLRRYRISDGFSHISTGGGAMIVFLVGKKLPALEALHPRSV